MHSEKSRLGILREAEQTLVKIEPPQTNKSIPFVLKGSNLIKINKTNFSTS